MRKGLIRILGNNLYQKIENFKKSIFPTKYDKLQKQNLKEQLSFYGTFITKKDLVFDIGGNIGDKANVFLSLQSQVVIVEPQAECIKILQNRFGSKATILQNGVGAKNEIKDFYVSNNSQLSSFDKNWVSDLESTRFSNTIIEKIEKIEIITLDSLIDKYGIPKFIKIDVEGFEIEVLKGLTKDFKLLSFEYAVPEKLPEVLNCLNHLKSSFSNLSCNYASGNINKNYGLENWIDIDEMIKYVQRDFFTNTFAGDVYVKIN